MVVAIGLQVYDLHQRPLDLVQHLMKVAQKVGAANDLPEGVLFVDTHLPGEPRRRPRRICPGSCPLETPILARKPSQRILRMFGK